MKTKLTLTVIIVISAALAGMVFTTQMPSARQNTDGAPTVADNAAEIPTSVLYDRMFRLIVSVRAKSKIQELRGERVTSLKSYFKDEANLSDTENEILEKKALKFMEAVQPLDDRATELLSEARELFPDGEVPAGQEVPRPPEELEGLQARREELALQYREELSRVLDTQKFTDLDKFVHRGFASAFQSVPLSSIPQSARREEK